MTSQNQPFPATTIAVLVCLGAIWGAAFMLIKVLVGDLGAAEIVAGRLVLGAIVVMGMLAVRGGLRWPGWPLFSAGAVLGVFDTIIPYVLVTWAETRIDSGEASVLISAMPLFTVLFAALTSADERIGAPQLGGIVTGFSGVVLLVGPDALGGGEPLGRLAVVGSALSYGAASVYARRLLRRTDALTLTGFKLTASALMTLPVSLAAGGAGEFAGMHADTAASLLALGVVSTGIAYVAYFRIVAAAGSVRASVVTYIIPAFGLLFGALFLDEPIALRTLGGLALIVSGVAVVMYGHAALAWLNERRTPCPEAAAA